MAKVKDLIQNDDQDLTIKNGDFVVGYSDEQHIQDILNSFPGFYKEFPLVGVGIGRYLNSSGKVPEMKRLIRLQLEADNYSVITLEVTDREKIEVKYDADRIL